jgi:hypothetical protein
LNVIREEVTSSFWGRSSSAGSPARAELDIVNPATVNFFLLFINAFLIYLKVILLKSRRRRATAAAATTSATSVITAAPTAAVGVAGTGIDVGPRPLRLESLGMLFSFFLYFLILY